MFCPLQIATLADEVATNSKYSLHGCSSIDSSSGRARLDDRSHCQCDWHRLDYEHLMVSNPKLLILVSFPHVANRTLAYFVNLLQDKFKKAFKGLVAHWLPFCTGVPDQPQV